MADGRCPSCNTVFTDEDLFCGECGADLSKARQVSAEPEIEISLAETEKASESPPPEPALRARAKATPAAQPARQSSPPVVRLPLMVRLIVVFSRYVFPAMTVLALISLCIPASYAYEPGTGAFAFDVLLSILDVLVWLAVCALLFFGAKRLAARDRSGIALLKTGVLGHLCWLGVIAFVYTILGIVAHGDAVNDSPATVALTAIAGLLGLALVAAEIVASVWLFRSAPAFCERTSDG